MSPTLTLIASSSVTLCYAQVTLGAGESTLCSLGQTVSAWWRPLSSGRWSSGDLTGNDDSCNFYDQCNCIVSIYILTYPAYSFIVKSLFQRLTYDANNMLSQPDKNWVRECSWWRHSSWRLWWTLSWSAAGPRPRHTHWESPADMSSHPGKSIISIRLRWYLTLCCTSRVLLL